MSAIMVLPHGRGTAAEAGGACKLSVLSSDCLPAEGIVAAFQFAELRHVRWRLGNQVTSTVPVAEGANSGLGHSGGSLRCSDLSAIVESRPRACRAACGPMARSTCPFLR